MRSSTTAAAVAIAAVVSQVVQATELLMKEIIYLIWELVLQGAYQEEPVLLIPLHLPAHPIQVVLLLVSGSLGNALKMNIWDMVLFLIIKVLHLMIRILRLLRQDLILTRECQPFLLQAILTNLL